MTQEKLEVWAIVELFGHNKIAGKVSEYNIGGVFVRVDVPDIGAEPAFTRFINPSAIYAINPVTEEVARGYAARLKSKPIDSWDAREVLKRIDEAMKLNAHEPTKVEYENEEDDQELM
jgi:hypothetical protein